MSHFVLINQLQWSCLSTAASRTFEIAPDRGKRLFTGAKFAKGFNHVVAATLATDPIVEGGHRVVFLSSDDEDAIAPSPGCREWPPQTSWIPA